MKLRLKHGTSELEFEYSHDLIMSNLQATVKTCVSEFLRIVHPDPPTK